MSSVVVLASGALSLKVFRKSFLIIWFRIQFIGLNVSCVWASTRFWYLLHCRATKLKAQHRFRSEGGQWLSGRVLDSRPKGSGFEPQQRHCVVVLEQDTFILA